MYMGFLFFLPNSMGSNGHSSCLAALVFPDFDSYDYLVTVLDERGQPLPGVSIFTDDYKVTASTDVEGIAVLRSVKYNEEINFTFIGYQPLKMPFYEIRKKNGKVRMYPEVKKLKEIVVIGRRDDTPDKVPYTTETVGKEEIALTESQTTVDALQQHAGVFVQKSQMGGGSPVMRGFEANRVLLVVDGVRLNNATYRGGHLQNAITIDNGMLERIEVTFGPGSLLYGSDALGGVVHFRSKEPKLNFDKTPGSERKQTNFYTRFASANEEKTVHADVNYGKKDWASLTSFTYTDYGDMRAGNNRPKGYEHFGRRLYFVRRVDGADQLIENVTLNSDSTFSDNSNIQLGTAYSRMDFTQKIKFQPDEKNYYLFNFQFSTSSDVPRYDNLIEQRSSDPKNLKWAEWYYGPQKRLLASLKARYSNPTSWYDRATFIGSFQKIEEDRLRRKLNSNRREFGLEDVMVFSLTADFDKSLDEAGQHELMYGADLNYNDVKSAAGNIGMSDEQLFLDELTRYPGNGNRVSTGAVYGNYRWSNGDSTLAFNGGLRFTIANLYSKFSNDSIIIWPQYYLDGISNTHSDLTWSTGLTYSGKDRLQLRVLLSKAFRSPNLDDFSKIREQNGFITIPNPDLKPERSYNAELSVAKQFGRVRNGGLALYLSATGYYTWLQNFIVRRKFCLPDGSCFLPSDGDELETVANVNAATGYIFGSSFNATVNFGQRFKLSSNINFTKGRESFYKDDGNGFVIDTLVPASHIPPTYGNTTLTYSAKKFTISASANYFGKKNVDEYGVVNIYKDGNGELVVEREGGPDNIELSYTTAGYLFEETFVNGQRRQELICNNPGPEGECDAEYVGTLAYTTFNLYTSWQLNPKLSLNLAVENITDLHYRPFASGLSGAGRNFILSLRASFGE